jgi:7-cyano-7-deazaguanine reductase
MPLNDPIAHQSQLGKPTPYCAQYDASLLFPIPRQEKRDELGFDLDTLPFQGLDIWTAYEVSWLNTKGKPIVAIADFSFPAESPNIIESKSFKLYLNSFNGSQFNSKQEVLDHLTKDLSQACQAPAYCELRNVYETETLLGSLPGHCLDDLDIEIHDYRLQPTWLTSETNNQVSETFNSHLLKSNCLVTGQPDWGSVVIRYEGPNSNQEGLLKYLISFRQHNEFHEQCVERIFTDIMRQCHPHKLTVYARYTRRGGLDINPYRSNFEDEFDISRLTRQ